MPRKIADKNGTGYLPFSLESNTSEMKDGSSLSLTEKEIRALEGQIKKIKITGIKIKDARIMDNRGQEVIILFDSKLTNNAIIKKIQDYTYNNKDTIKQSVTYYRFARDGEQTVKRINSFRLQKRNTEDVEDVEEDPRMKELRDLTTMIEEYQSKYFEIGDVSYIKDKNAGYNFAFRLTGKKGVKRTPKKINKKISPKRTAVKSRVQ